MYFKLVYVIMVSALVLPDAAGLTPSSSDLCSPSSEGD